MQNKGWANKNICIKFLIFLFLLIFNFKYSNAAIGQTFSKAQRDMNQMGDSKIKQEDFIKSGGLETLIKNILADAAQLRETSTDAKVVLTFIKNLAVKFAKEDVLIKKQSAQEELVKLFSNETVKKIIAYTPVFGTEKKGKEFAEKESKEKEKELEEVSKSFVTIKGKKTEKEKKQAGENLQKSVYGKEIIQKSLHKEFGEDYKKFKTDYEKLFNDLYSRIVDKGATGGKIKKNIKKLKEKENKYLTEKEKKGLKLIRSNEKTKFNDRINLKINEIKKEIEKKISVKPIPQDTTEMYNFVKDNTEEAIRLTEKLYLDDDKIEELQKQFEKLESDALKLKNVSINPIAQSSAANIIKESSEFEKNLKEEDVSEEDIEGAASKLEENVKNLKSLSEKQDVKNLEEDIKKLGENEKSKKTKKEIKEKIEKKVKNKNIVKKLKNAIEEKKVESKSEEAKKECKNALEEIDKLLTDWNKLEEKDQKAKFIDYIDKLVTQEQIVLDTLPKIGKDGIKIINIDNKVTSGKNYYTVFYSVLEFIKKYCVISKFSLYVDNQLNKEIYKKIENLLKSIVTNDSADSLKSFKLRIDISNQIIESKNNLKDRYDDIEERVKSISTEMENFDKNKSYKDFVSLIDSINNILDYFVKIADADFCEYFSNVLPDENQKLLMSALGKIRDNFVLKSALFPKLDDYEKAYKKVDQIDKYFEGIKKVTTTGPKDFLKVLYDTNSAININKVDIKKYIEEEKKKIEEKKEPTKKAVVLSEKDKNQLDNAITNIKTTNENSKAKFTLTYLNRTLDYTTTFFALSKNLNVNELNFDANSINIINEAVANIEKYYKENTDFILNVKNVNSLSTLIDSFNKFKKAYDALSPDLKNIFPFKNLDVVASESDKIQKKIEEKKEPAKKAVVLSEEDKKELNDAITNIKTTNENSKAKFTLTYLNRTLDYTTTFFALSKNLKVNELNFDANSINIINETVANIEKYYKANTDFILNVKNVSSLSTLTDSFNKFKTAYDALSEDLKKIFPFKNLDVVASESDKIQKKIEEKKEPAKKDYSKIINTNYDYLISSMKALNKIEALVLSGAKPSLLVDDISYVIDDVTNFLTKIEQFKNDLVEIKKYMENNGKFTEKGEGYKDKEFMVASYFDLFSKAIDAINKYCNKDDGKILDKILPEAKENIKDWKIGELVDAYKLLNDNTDILGIKKKIAAINNNFTNLKGDILGW